MAERVRLRMSASVRAEVNRSVTNLFSGCALMGKTFLATPAAGAVYLFRLNGTRHWFGAVYPDGASMVWPNSWLRSHKIHPIEEGDSERVDGMRAVVRNVQSRDPAAFAESTYSTLIERGGGRKRVKLRTRLNNGSGRVRLNNARGSLSEGEGKAASPPRERVRLHTLV